MKRSPASGHTPSPPSSSLLTPQAEADDGCSSSPSPSPTKSKSKSESKLKLKTGSTPSPAKRQRSTPASTPTKAQGPWSAGWSPDKKEAIIERYLTLGIKASNIGDIANEVCFRIDWFPLTGIADDKFNITKAQLQNAIQVGHKNNLRDKAAKSVR